MLRYIIIFNVFGAFCVAGQFMVEPGPKYPATKGELWPRPQYQKKEDTFFTIDPDNLTFKIVGHSCSLLTSAVDRFKSDHKKLAALATQPRRRRTKMRGRLEYQGALTEIQINLKAPCDDRLYPQFGMDESYNITVSTPCWLSAKTVWGLIRAFQSLYQLTYIADDYDELRVGLTEIVDYPRYTHRGLLLDTSRHFISLKNIYLTLDAMYMNKMNVLHWHIVDDQSFPYQSEKFPELSNQGAYHPALVYTKEDIRQVVKYAASRAIRVLPEIDVPGHTRSWGVAHPEILTECYKGNKKIGLGPMNPIKNSTYELLRDLILEVQEYFPDNYYHIGGDEVDLYCWMSNPELLDYMEQHNMSDAKELHALFMTKVIPLLGRSAPIVWQEVFDENVPLSNNTLVQVWKGNSDEASQEINKILEAGHKVIFSEAWYLDHLSSGGDWENFYKADPEQMVANATLASNIVGGEACMWGESVDDRNIISRVWPRASAVAEVLWSKPLDDKDAQLESARHRLEEQTCRMVNLDIGAQPPNGPGFCIDKYFNK